MKKRAITLVCIIGIFTVISSVVIAQLDPTRFNGFPYNALYVDGTNSVCTSYSHFTSLYKIPTVDISIGYAVPCSWVQPISFSYQLNATTHSTTYSDTLAHSEWSDFTYHVYHIFGTLNDLSNGFYTMTINADYANGTTNRIDGKEFTVDTNFIEPTLAVISPINSTYHTNAIDLTYNIDSTVIWSYYTLDSTSYSPSDNWVPFKGNITIANISEGSHTLIVAVQTNASRLMTQPISQQTIAFKIDTTIQP
jgi:hypothetical protein